MLEENTKPENVLEDFIKESIKNEFFTLEEISTLSNEDLLNHSIKMIANLPPQEINRLLNNINEELKKRQLIEVKEKKESFVLSGGNAIDFNYKNPLFESFQAHYFEHKKKLATYFNFIKKVEEENYEKKLELVERLKGLYLSNTVNKDIYKSYNNIRAEWRSIDKVPADKFKTLTANFQHHLTNFFSFLDLNKELQSKLFEENLAERKKIIAYAKELVGETNIKKALTEIHILHKRWKDTDPVDDKFKNSTWDDFQHLSNQILDKRKELHLLQEKEEQENLQLKSIILSKIIDLVEEKATGNKQWRDKIDLFTSLENEFLATGKVPKENKDELWGEFKKIARIFNHLKIEHFREQKNLSKENIKKKRDLIEIAKEAITNSNKDKALSVFKKIQNDWRMIGPVDKFYSNALWNEFKGLCDSFFEGFKNHKLEENTLKEKHTLIKKSLLQEFTIAQTSEDKETMLAQVNAMINQWYENEINESTFAIDADFEKFIFKKCLSLEIEESKINLLFFNKKLELIDKFTTQDLYEHIIREEKNKINKVSAEIIQLENNLGFFANSKPNPITDNVLAQINTKKELVTQSNKFCASIKKIVSKKNTESIVEITSENIIEE